MYSSVIFVAERIRMPWYSGSLARNSSSLQLSPRSTSKCSLSIATPLSASFSLTRIFSLSVMPGMSSIVVIGGAQRLAFRS